MRTSDKLSTAVSPLSRALIITLPPRGARWNDREREPEGEICESEREYLRSHAYPLRESLLLFPPRAYVGHAFRKGTLSRNIDRRVSPSAAVAAAGNYTVTHCAPRPRRAPNKNLAARCKTRGGSRGGAGGGTGGRGRSAPGGSRNATQPRWVRMLHAISHCCGAGITLCPYMSYHLTRLCRFSDRENLRATSFHSLYRSGWRKRNFLEKNANKQYTLYIVKKYKYSFFFLLLLFLSHLEIYVIFVIDVVYVARSLREEWIFYA